MALNSIGFEMGAGAAGFLSSGWGRAETEAEWPEGGDNSNSTEAEASCGLIGSRNSKAL